MRAILRASAEVELADTLCPRRVPTSDHTAAGITLFLPTAEGARHSSYAGPDQQCTEHPDRFWDSSSRAAALQALLQGERLEPAAAAGFSLFPLHAGAVVFGVLAAMLGGLQGCRNALDQLQRERRLHLPAGGRLRGCACPSRRTGARFCRRRSSD